MSRAYTAPGAGVEYEEARLVPSEDAGLLETPRLLAMSGRGGLLGGGLGVGGRETMYARCGEARLWYSIRHAGSATTNSQKVRDAVPDLDPRRLNPDT